MSGPPTVLLLPDYRRNPYLERLMQALQTAGWQVEVGSGVGSGRRFDVVHLHWERPWIVRDTWRKCIKGLIRLVTMLAIARARGSRLVWTVHNLRDHDHRRPRFERGCQLALARLVHVVVVHHPAAVEMARDWLMLSRRSRVEVMPHGPLSGPSTITRRSARRSLGVPDDVIVLASVGAIRSYKRLEVAAAAVARLRRSDLRLIIAGWPGSATELESVQQQVDPRRVSVHARYLTALEFDRVLAACDGVLLCVEEHFSSGSAVSAVVAGRAVVGGTSPHVEHLCPVGGHIVVDTSDPDSLARDLERLSLDQLHHGGRVNALRSEELTWDDAVASLERAYGRGSTA